MSLRRAVEAKDEAAKLKALVAAWKKQRHPRIADVIDRVSAALLKDAAPVKAGSVPGRVKACIALLKGGDVVDVGRVLATEWPGSYDAALPLVQALAKLDDPRVAREFARQVERPQYLSLASRSLWMPVFRRLGELGDVRQLPVLQAQDARAKGGSWQARVKSIEATATKRLSTLRTPKLSADDERWLSTLEEPFAAAAATEKATGKSGAELLAAIYANPGDLGLRAVYGDWLSERGDPRGELINLQLGAPSEKSETRIRLLVKKHWQEWVGPLADWCCRHTTRAKMVPTFKAGFAWSVHIDQPQYGAEDKLRALFARPEWRTVEVIEDWPDYVVPLAEALAHPSFASVRVLKLFQNASDLQRLVEVKPPLALEEVQVSIADAEPPALERLPSLRRITTRASDLRSLTRVLPRLEQVTFDSYRVASELTAEHWKLLEQSGVGAVELGSLRVARTPGAKHFEVVTLRDLSMTAFLERVPATLRAFAASQPELEGDEEALKALKKLLAKRFPSLDLTKLATRATFKAPQQRHVRLDLSQMVPLFQQGKLERLLVILTEDFGATLDTFQINRNIDRPLAADRVEKLETWVKNERARSLTLLRKGADTELTVHKDAPFADFKLPLGDVDRFIASAKKLAALAEAKTVRFSWAEGGVSGTWKAIEKALRAL